MSHDRHNQNKTTMTDAFHSLVPNFHSIGVDVITETANDGTTISIITPRPGENKACILDKAGAMVADNLSLLSSLDPRQVSDAVNGPYKSLIDTCLVSAAVLPFGTDVKLKHGPATTAVDACAELFLNHWDKNARTQAEIQDLLSRLENRTGSLGDRIYSKILG